MPFDEVDVSGAVGQGRRAPRSSGRIDRFALVGIPQVVFFAIGMALPLHAEARGRAYVGIREHLSRVRWPSGERIQSRAFRSMAVRQHRLSDDRCMHAGTCPNALDQLPYAGDVDVVCIESSVAALASDGCASCEVFFGFRAWHSFFPVPDAIGNHGHQYDTHLFTGQAGDRSGSDRRVHPAIRPGTSECPERVLA